MYKKASRLKLRFSTDRGTLNAEDLWDLSLTSLDSLAKSLNKQVKDSSEESFISDKPKGNAELELKFEIVKDVIADKLKEAELKKTAAIRRARRNVILEQMASKEDEALKAKSMDELKAELDALENEDI